MTYDMAADATRHVCLILDNDEGLYHERREMVASSSSAAELAGRLRAWCEEMVEQEIGEEMGLSRELLFYVVLPNVDWYSMAEDYIAEERES